MKLSYQKFCASLTLTYKAILFSSFEDELLQAPFITHITHLFPGVEVLRIPASEALNGAYPLLENLRSPTLFGPPPKIVVDEVTPSHLNALKKLVEQLLPSDKLLLTSGYLKASTALRTFFEATNDLFFTPIYTPNESQIQQTVSALFKTYGHSPTSELVTYLANFYSKSTQLLEAELVPFCLLFTTACPITLSQYLSYTQIASPNETAFLKAFLLRQAPDHAVSPFSSPIGFLRLMSFHIQRLLEQKGSHSRFPIKTSLDMKPVYEKANSLWSVSELTEQLKKIQSLEVSYKTQSLDNQSDILYSLFSLFPENPKQATSQKSHSQ